MSQEKFDCCVVGAGVVGLAVAREFSRHGLSVVVVEKEKHIGSGVSSRNSEVIHAGIYYPQNSLKALCCVEGKRLLYEYCETRQVPHRRIGKLIVATNEQQCATLESLQQKAAANDVRDLQWVNQHQLSAMEPLVRGSAALLSPSTGIVDSHSFMSSLLNEIETQGGVLSLDTEILAAESCAQDEGFKVLVNSVGENFEFTCTTLINAAGLGAQEVAARVNCSQQTIPRLYYCKGCYFAYSGRPPFQHLIYPVPDPNTTGLGVHATIDMGGQVKFGPDTEYIDDLDYLVPMSRAEAFATAISSYFPGVTLDKLTPSYAGIRPKIQGPNEPAKDFQIVSPQAGLIHLFGIESPGLTSSLSIAAKVYDKLQNY